MISRPEFIAWFRRKVRIVHEQITLMVHLLVAMALIALILLQRGKGADIGASFGAGASQTLFGSAGSGNALTSMTACRLFLSAVSAWL